MVKLTINREQKSFDAPADMPLLWVLRDVLGMTGTKFGCGIAQCGACTVHIDGKAVRSCMLPVGAVRDRAVTTIEGVGASPIGAKVQNAWLDLEVIQCGYCQSGQIMAPNPDDSDIDAAMAGNICRCPFLKSSIRLFMPSVRLAERVSIALRITSGLVAGKFDGLIASIN